MTTWMSKHIVLSITRQIMEAKHMKRTMGVRRSTGQASHDLYVADLFLEHPLRMYTGAAQHDDKICIHHIQEVISRT